MTGETLDARRKTLDRVLAGVWRLASGVSSSRRLEGG
jgi:hypothetical protein